MNCVHAIFSDDNVAGLRLESGDRLRPQVPRTQPCFPLCANKWGIQTETGRAGLDDVMKRESQSNGLAHCSSQLLTFATIFCFFACAGAPEDANAPPSPIQRRFANPV